MPQQLPGKVAIVTGAANGIGKAIAERYGGEGAHVGSPSSAVAMVSHSASSDSVAAGRPARRYQ